MTNEPAHFAIHADDLDRARKFYGAVFGWTFKGLDAFGVPFRRPGLQPRRNERRSAGASAPEGRQREGRKVHRRTSFFRLRRFRTIDAMSTATLFEPGFSGTDTHACTEASRQRVECVCAPATSVSPLAPAHSHRLLPVASRPSFSVPPCLCDRFYSTMHPNRNRRNSLKTNDPCTLYSTMIPGGADPLFHQSQLANHHLLRGSNG
jgi:hypothetical protein